MTLRSAWDLLRSAYPRASPHELYWRQLRELEAERFGRVTLSEEDVGPTLQDMMRKGSVQ